MEDKVGNVSMGEQVESTDGVYSVDISLCGNEVFDTTQSRRY
jgi:hypothetical protein